MNAFPTPSGRIAAAFLVIAALLAAAASASAQTQAQAPLPRVELQAGIHLISAEVAADDRSRARGLMFREHLGPSEGMLFVFESPGSQCFWMRNTKVPLSIAFLADDGSIVNVARMQPMSEDSHCSARPVRYALEMTQGWFEKRGLGPGSRLAGPKGMFAGPR
ncbi:DUF192 domain-containing protein [Quisquiliibacterium transsilvanicum]|uniref:DUF192 domain-containing protein n=1 Tax=Quisquiliibacterium transsilvanicum TaxID=1549638 RepID=A0A7W8HF16_9BURK|nr:DUF192 domain-containing protein [Quisquiliibacterium transsilvanicum]MBB5270800.1 hypothetical protein [Quisquiliibacterium transsilvanicum]